MRPLITLRVVVRARTRKSQIDREMIDALATAPPTGTVSCMRATCLPYL